ncbi:hypothetical protein LOK49_LG03G01458 [Camellia lanceoleosa]|uniref:Uncharacterized protein n=1 Tax=Camellia lanceoleosa TaxID=1840588 RepID=A0ACC0IGQ0_9ERIC|nr:hypothetical protein LOK49_LG03G01458 [Camellia lanceoleosa]
MSLVSKAIVSWCKNHPNGNKDGEYDYASASTRMEGDGSNEDNDGDYDCAPAASWESGDDDDDNEHYCCEDDRFSECCISGVNPSKW